MYVIFAYNNYYPFGGFDDLKSQPKDLEEATDLIRGYCQNYDVVELCQITDTGLIILGFTSSWIDAIGVGGWLRELQKKEAEQCK